MTIAELFVKIGVQGTEAAAKGLGNIKGGLADIASSSLAAKAAVAGVIIGLERLTGFASQVGMDLYKFNVTTGLSTQELQKWQYALMKVDVSGDEVASTIAHIQASMTDMRLGKGAPEGFAQFADAVALDQDRVDDTFYVLSKWEEFLKNAPASVGNQIAKTAGFTENMIQGMRVVNRERDKLSKSKSINDDEIKNLVKINSAWKDFWFSLKTMGVKFIALEGLGAVKELADAFGVIISAIQGLAGLADEFPVIKAAAIGLALAISAAFAPVTTVIALILAGIAELKHLTDGTDMFGGLLKGKQVQEMKSWLSKPADWVSDIMDEKRLADASDKSSNVNTQNNTFHIDGSGEPKETAEEIMRHIQGAARQSATQTGGY